MSNVGQAALTIVGTAVGSYFGYPQLGFMLGSLAGQQFFPTKLPGVTGPRLGDARTTMAQLGAPVVEVIGTDAVFGNINWMSPVKEISNTEEVGGKGGPSQSSTTFSYTQSISIGLCRGPMGGLQRIWENGKLVYDIRAQLEDESDETYAARVAAAQEYAYTFVLYLGDEEQEPDPTIEADKGVGEVPAWRGLMYIVFPNRKLREDQGLRHPNFKFEVSSSFIGNCNLEWSNEVLYPWVDDLVNPENPLNAHVYTTGVDTEISQPTSDLATLLSQSAATLSRPIQNVGVSYLLTAGPFTGDAVDGKTVSLAPDSYPYQSLQRMMHHVSNDAVVTTADIDSVEGNPCLIPPYLGIPGQKYYVAFNGGALEETTSIPGTEDTPMPMPPFAPYEYASRCSDTGFWKQTISAMPVIVTRSPGLPGDEDSGWERVEGHLFRVLQQFSASGGAGGTVRLPLNPCIPFGDPRYYDEAFWTAAYEAAVLEGTMEEGLDYDPIEGGGDYPREQEWAYVRGGVPLFLFETAKVYPWMYGGNDPRNPKNLHTYTPQAKKDGYAGTGVYSTLGEALNNMAAFEGGPPLSLVSSILGHNPNYSSSYDVQPFWPDVNYSDPYPPLDARIGGPLNIPSKSFNTESLFFGEVSVSGTVSTWISQSADSAQQLAKVAASIGQFVAARYPDHPSTVFANGKIIVGGYQPGLQTANGFYLPVGESDASTAFATELVTMGVYVARIQRPPVIEDDDPFPDTPWVEYDGNWTWLARKQEGGVYFNSVSSLPLGPARPNNHPDNNEAFWTAAYDAAVIAGTMVPGLVYGIHYPNTESVGYARVVCEASAGTAGLVPLSDVITHICGRVDIPPERLDVSDLASVEIVGYTITRVMSARDALEPLRNVGYFDVVESGDLLKFVRRGKAVARVISESDFAYEGGATPPPDITTKDALETDLPRTIRVHYRAPSRDYEDGEQISPSRSTAVAVNDVDIEVAVAIPDDMAVKIAYVLWADAWEGRRSHGFTLDAYHMDLEGADVLSIPVDGYLQRVRINTIDETIGVLRKFEVFRDYDGNYTPKAVADPPERAPGVIVVLSPSELIIMDLPALRDVDDNPGLYVTTRVQNEGSTWKGSSVFKSVDAGASFTEMSSVVSEPTVGTILTTMPAGDSQGFDERYTLDVELESGTLQSRTDAAIADGENLMAVGANGRWELLQFCRVTQLTSSTYRLSRMIRGRKGTEWAMGLMEVGDTFVIVSGQGIARLPVSVEEIGLDIIWKSLTFGMEYNTAIDQTYASTGEALRPYSVIDIEGTLQDDGDITVSWLRRGRLGHELTSGIEIPLSEAVEKYEIDFAIPGSPLDVQRTLTSFTKSVEYPVATRSADFGSGEAIIQIDVYQISAVVGRGHVASIEFAVPADDTVYPENTAEIELSGVFDTGLAFDVQLIFTPRTGSPIVVNSNVTGAGKASLDDMADELRSELDTGLPSTVVVSRVGSVVSLSTYAGSFSATATQPVPVLLTSLLQEPLPITVAVQHTVALDLWVDDFPAGIRAPDSDVAYQIGGSAFVNWQVYGLTWEINKALGYGVNQNTAWSIPNGIFNYRNQALNDAGPAILAVLPQYVDFASYSMAVGSVRPAVVIRCKPGYFISYTNGSDFSTAGSHPCGYELELERTVQGVAPFPAGAKQRHSTYIGPPTAGMVATIVLDGTPYSHTITGPEAADLYGVGFHTVYEDLRDQIEASGNFTVYLAHEGDNTASPMDIERNVANTPFTISAFFETGLDITINIT